MTRKFDHVTPERFAALKEVLQAQGIEIPEGNSGEIHVASPPITLAFTYDGAGELSLSITKKPVMIPESMVWSKIETGLDSVG